MAESDDWRAERAAQLAGTPFARPGKADRLDDTLPIQSVAAPTAPPAAKPAAFAVPPPAAPANRPIGRTLALVGTLAVVAAGVGVFELRKGTESDVRNVPAPPVAVTAPARPTPAVVAPVVPVPSPSPVVSAPTATVAPVSTPDARTEVSAAKPHHLVRSGKTAAVAAPSHGARKARNARGRGDVQPATAPSSPTLVGTITDRPAKAVAKIPVCQPGVYKRSARTCRPSHARQVREPFYDN